MKRCFVIQPFDNDKYDKRYVDVFKPAIEKSGFESYRIDNDLSVRVTIDEIEKNISGSQICFAEITTDNPNVWYELGYAFACKKDVVMVCSEERKGFPFDIQQYQIIKYKTGSPSDFGLLENLITNKIIAFSSKTETIKEIVATPITDREGLKSHEIAMLILIIKNQTTREDSMPVYQLNDEMNKAGYNDIATNVGLRTLKNNSLLETFTKIDDWNNDQEYFACRLTEMGEQWIINNQHLLEFKTEDPPF